MENSPETKAAFRKILDTQNNMTDEELAKEFEEFLKKPEAGWLSEMLHEMGVELVTPEIKENKE